MRQKIVVLISLCCLLPFSKPADVLADIDPANAGIQVQKHLIEVASDRNHEPYQWRHKLPASKLEQVQRSKTLAAKGDLQIPLRRGLSNTNPGLLFVAAFVDHDEVNPDSLLDYICGERTYDSPGFSHNGTDYNGVQFPWLTMANDGMVVIAAADGEIIDIHDGEPDKQCAPDPASEANYVVLVHSDGTITIYAHMKTGSVTPRKVGDMVEQGDYLGVMGSSGQSNGPHLHLGVQDLSNNLFDPYTGTCNTLNSESYWAAQEPYVKKEIMAIDTHSDFPERPPCPQVEEPNFNDVFAPDDIIFVSVTVRDFQATDTLDVEMRDPAGQVIFSTAYSDPTIPSSQSFAQYWGLPFTQPLPEGEYSWSATYAGQTRTHIFYVGDGPPPPPAAKPANNAFTGLWFDALLDGEGFNIVTADSGTIIYFYGSDSRGNRLWLISDLIQGEIVAGQPLEVLMFESTGGTFSSPVQSSRSLSAWGTLILTFSGCMNGQSTLNGMDGVKVSQISKLAGVAGASCVDGDVPADSGLAGLWFDLDGEGYNLIVAPVGRILYYYGFNKNGLRLWLISDLITGTLSVGNAVEITMYESTQGTFEAPVPSGDALVPWGSATITAIDCNTVNIVIVGADGTKTGRTVRLAGIIGLSCTG